MKKFFSLFATLLVLAIALWIGRTLWVDYMDSPWTRDGRVRADIINVAADVSGSVVEVPVRDNQWVKRGDLLMQIDPEHYRIAVKQAQALLASRKATWEMRKLNARRRADMDELVISAENRDDASNVATSALADYQLAQAQLEAAELNLARTRVLAAVDGYVTNLNVHRGDYARVGEAKMAVVDMNSFWVYGFFEETKLPHLKVGDPADLQLMSGEVLKGGGQGLHGRAGQLQAFYQSAIGQQMPLATGQIELIEQPIPMLTTDAHAHDSPRQPDTPSSHARLRLMAQSGSRVPFSISSR